MADTIQSPDHGRPRQPAGRPAARAAQRRKSTYPYWFLLPGGVIFVVFFLVPTVIAFYFSLTRWTLFDRSSSGSTTTGSSSTSRRWSRGSTHTLIYAVVTSGLKVVLGMAARGAADRPDHRPRLHALGRVLPGPGQHDRRRPDLPGADGPDRRGDQRRRSASSASPDPAWLTDPQWALLSVAFVDVWKGVGLATVIYIAGILSIPGEYYEAAKSRRRKRVAAVPAHHPAAGQPGDRRRSSSCR